GVHRADYPGSNGSPIFRLSGTSHAMVYEREMAGAPGRELRLMVLDADDEEGTAAVTYPLTSTVRSNIGLLEFMGVQSTPGSATIVYGSRVDGGPFEARVIQFDGSDAGPPVLFDDSVDEPSYTAGDYEPLALRVGDDTYVMLGGPFEGA